MPFQWRADREQALVEKLRHFFVLCEPVSVRLQGFGCFPPRVIYINAEKTAALEQLQQRLNRYCREELNLFNANYKDIPFHPHVTLAFRDLKKNVFEIAWAEFKDREFSGEFLAKQIALLKHNGRAWGVFQWVVLQKQVT
jgi:2'-5' RNA ligase